MTTQKITVYDVVEAAHAYRRVRGAVETAYTDGGWMAVAVANGNKVLVSRDGTAERVRVHVIDVGYGEIRQVRFDSSNRAIYDIVLDTPVGPENDLSRDWVARRGELEEVQA